MKSELKLAEIRIEVVRKAIKNVHLSVHPPAGRVRIAAPSHLSHEAIRAYAIGRIGWIRRQQTKLREQERETPREYLDRETHYVWGRRCLLRVVEREGPPTVDWRQHRLMLFVRAGTSCTRRGEIVEAWYRDQLRSAIEPLAAEWQPRIGVSLQGIFVQRMRTRWGSANPARRTIRINTDLAKKPRECLEYILVHELIHLLEPTHNARFVCLMDQHLPAWQHRLEMLNRLPVRHEEWGY
jgi:predicted metal-dependent hydrolase